MSETTEGVSFIGRVETCLTGPFSERAFYISLVLIYFKHSYYLVRNVRKRFVVRKFMSKLTKQEVEHIAELARLHLTEEEKELFAGQLSSILEWVNKLQEVDTSKVLPMAHVLEVKNVTRDDEVKPVPHSHEILLGDMPEREGDLLKVPAVFEAQSKEF